ncbi:MAG TPA: hypothetical protein ENI23_17510 [bacterium]|nr:hypothetical protein [bacterium]
MEKFEETEAKSDIPLVSFQLQVEFAKRAAELSGESLDESFMKYTSFYRRVGNNDWDFNPQSKAWLKFLDLVHSGKDPAKTVLELHVTDETPVANKENSLRFGSFRFSINEGKDTVNIHFRNLDKSGKGPLSGDRLKYRTQELGEMFKYVRENHPDVRTVKGGTWLYNYDAYRNLFPPEYTQNEKVEKVPFPRHMGIWGQLLDSSGGENKERVREFRKKIQKAKNIDELLQAFPFRMLYQEGDIEPFYEFYKVK